MNRFTAISATLAMALTVTTAIAAETTTTGQVTTPPGQKCEDLSGVQRKRCMGATNLENFQKKLDRKMQRLQFKQTRKSDKSDPTVVRGNRRRIQEGERDRQRKFREMEMQKKEKMMWKDTWGSSSSSKTSSSSSTSSAGSSSSATSSSSSAQ